MSAPSLHIESTDSIIVVRNLVVSIIYYILSNFTLFSIQFNSYSIFKSENYDIPYIPGQERHVEGSVGGSGGGMYRHIGQGMRACNNNNMCNPIIKEMWEFTHVIIVACPHSLSCCIYTALILCLAAYIPPSSPVLLHIYCLHPLSCCIDTALCLAKYNIVKRVKPLKC